MNKIPHPDVLPGIGYPDKNKILETVCNHYGIPVVALYKRTRERKISEPRMVVMALFKYALGWTNDMIAIEFMLNNASVVHGRKNVRNIFLTNRTARERIDSLLKDLFLFEDERKIIIEKIVEFKTRSGFETSKPQTNGHNISKKSNYRWVQDSPSR